MSTRVPGYHHPIDRTADLSDEALRGVTLALRGSAEHNDRTGEFPWDGVYRVHEAGLLTAAVRARFGGQNAGAVDAVRIFTALGSGDPAVALISAMTYILHLYNEEGREFVTWPPGLYHAIVEESRSRPVLLNSINAEPAGVTREQIGLPDTRVTRADDGWLLDGYKTSATASVGLSYHLVWARQGDDDASGFAIVPSDATGVSVVERWDHLGQRASASHDVRYQNVWLPTENFVARPATLRGPRRAGGVVDLIASAIYLGAARAAQEFVIDFAARTVNSRTGSPLAAEDAIQRAVGESEAQLLLAQSTLLQIAGEFDSGSVEAAGHNALLAKLIASRAAVTAVDGAIAALGNAGLSRHNPLERHFRDVLVSRAHSPKDADAILTTGRRLLGTLDDVAGD